MMLRLRELAIFIGLTVVAAVATPVAFQSLKTQPAEEAIVLESLIQDSVHTAKAAPAEVRGTKVALAVDAKMPKEKPKDDEPFPEWDLKGSGLSTRELKPWLESARVKEIVYYDSETPQIFEPKPSAMRQPPDSKDGSTLFVSTKKNVREYALERASDLGSHRGRYPGALGQPLPPDSYEVVRFDPGWMEDRQTRVPRPTHLHQAVQGPDYSMEEVDRRDARNPNSKAMQELKSKVVSFGHEGMMVLRVSQGGVIVDGNGADFAICENPFPAGPNLVHEYAHVGVAESAVGQVTWFPCDPRQGIRAGCAGIVPVEDGCDLFDLAEVGKQKIQYIVIKDIGTNAFAFRDGEKINPGSEGFDLDAMKLFHAYMQ